MWYEQVYSGVITFGFVAAMLHISGPFNKLDTGRWRRRDVSNNWREWTSKRDHRLTGNYYKISGLESIKE